MRELTGLDLDIIERYRDQLADLDVMSDAGITGRISIFGAMRESNWTDINVISCGITGGLGCDERYGINWSDLIF